MIKVGSKLVWLWVAIKPENRQMIVAVTVSKERNMLIAEKFISRIVKIDGKHPVSTEGGETYYPMVCKFLKLQHHLHSSSEKSLIEIKMQYIKR